MPIKNYRSRLSVKEIVRAINDALDQPYITDVLTQREGGQVTAISFAVRTSAGKQSFRLPANVDGVERKLQADESLTASQRTRARAEVIAWRTILDWIEVQLALVDVGVSTSEQVFAMYALSDSGQTINDVIGQRGLKALIGPSK